jgi:isopenicillin N synthase-like dioxygenase
MSATAQTMDLSKPAIGRWAKPNEVPVIDFAPLAGTSDAAIDAVAKEVDDASREIGFFTVVNHPVPVPLIRRMFQESARFFSQPLEEKLQLHMRHSANFRGYLPMDEDVPKAGRRGRAVQGFQEHMAPGQLPPRKPNKNEVFQISLELDAGDPDVRAGKPLHGPNLWPENLPGFRESRARVLRDHAPVCRPDGFGVRARAGDGTGFLRAVLHQAISSSKSRSSVFFRADHRYPHELIV